MGDPVSNSFLSLNCSEFKHSYVLQTWTLGTHNGIHHLINLNNL